MATLVVQHEVSEYGAWRAVYDDVEGLRAQFGCRGQRVLQSPADGNNVLVLHEFPSLDQAEAFAGSDELKAALQRAGVASAPRIEFWQDSDA